VTITTKLGYFVFDMSVPFSQADLIADTVTGQWFNPDPKEPKLTSVQDCYDFILYHPTNKIAAIEFELVLR
jgi:hypothetical protein